MEDQHHLLIICSTSKDLRSYSFSTTAIPKIGTSGRAAMVTYKRELPYSVVVGWLRCRLSFSLLRSAVMCLRGSRSARHHVQCNSTDIAVHDSRAVSHSWAELLTMQLCFNESAIWFASPLFMCTCIIHIDVLLYTCAHVYWCSPFWRLLLPLSANPCDWGGSCQCIFVFPPP